MDKMDKVKQSVLEIAYKIAKACVPFPEKIKICPAYTSNSIDGCTSESGKIFKNKNEWFSIYIRYEHYCVCMVRLKAETLSPIQVEIGKGNRKFITYKIGDIDDIKSYSDKIQSNLIRLLD